ncbi:MAG: hypothetical protein GY941_21710 [Planctomycetes bacterium]|nr:hypothetical protein [Planctomycetota bacterium]
MASNITEETIHFVGSASHQGALGANLVTNGTFTGSATGWDFNLDNAQPAYSSNAVAWNGTQGGNCQVFQENVFTIGKIYQLKFDLSGYTAGQLTIGFGSGNFIDLTEANGPYVLYETALNNARLFFQGNSSFAGTIDNVEVYEWPGDPLPGGGCTVATYTGDPGDYMDADGKPVADEDDCVITGSGTVFTKGGSSVTIAGAVSGTDGVYEVTAVTPGGSGAFDDVVVGTLAYVAYGTTGSDLVTDGAFANWTGDDPTDWTLTTAETGSLIVSEDSAKCRLQSGVDERIGVKQTILTSGKSYKVVLDIITDSGGGITTYGDSAWGSFGSTGNDQVSYGDADGTDFSVETYYGSTTNMVIDNVEVYELNATVTIGGAYTNLQLALDDDSTDVDDGAAKHNRYILTNLDETISSTIQPGAGDRATGKFVKIIGYNSAAKVINNVLYSDMDVQSWQSNDFTTSYYAGAIEAIRSVEGAVRKRPAGDWIDIDADGNAIDVWTVGGDNIEARNLKIHNTDKAAGNDCVTASAAREGTTWINCWFDTADDLIDGGNLDESVFMDCYFGNVLGSTNASYIGMTSTLYSGCVFNGSGKTYVFANIDDSTVINCLCYGSANGIAPTSGTAKLIGNVLYEQTTYGIHLFGAANAVVMLNNIISTQAIIDIGIYGNASGGTVIGSNNCVYSVTADAPLTVPYTNANAGAGVAAFWLKNTIEQDPQFIDASNFDFRLSVGSPCRGVGMRGFDPVESVSDIGTDSAKKEATPDYSP